MSDNNNGDDDDDSMLYEWSAAKDDDGQIYYYNSTTNETSWDPPDDGRFNPLPSVEDNNDKEDAGGADAVPSESGKDEQIKKEEGSDEAMVDAAGEKEGGNESQAVKIEESSSDAAAPDTATAVWSAHRTDEGEIYYFNEVTQETTWDKPADELIVADDADTQDDVQDEVEDKNDADSKLPTVKEEFKDDTVVEPDQDGDTHMPTVKDENDQEHQAQEDEKQPLDAFVVESTGSGDVDGEDQEPLAAGDWVEYKNDDGEYYYYNTVTEETTWERPSEFDQLEEEPKDTTTNQQEDQGTKSPQPTSPSDTQSRKSPDDRGMMPMSLSMSMSDDEDIDLNDEGTQDLKTDQVEETKSSTATKEEVLDPAQQKVKDAKDALSAKDAILEDGVIQNLLTVVQSDGGNPQNAVAQLVQSTQGQTAICGLMSRWLADLKSHPPSGSTNVSGSGSDPKSDKEKRFDSAAEDIREVTHDVLSKLSKESYSTRLGDGILMKDQAQVRYINDLIDSDRWRRLLIELSASNKEDALMMFALKRISEKGHHREIARRINQSEHFSVFHAMLESELGVLGKIAVSACVKKDTSISLDELVGNLGRSSTGTAYTYLYAYEVLRYLVEKAKHDSAAMVDEERLLYARAVRKWERLIEVLQSRMIDPFADSDDGKTLSATTRKRRLDIALTISELYQRQRRRILPSETDTAEYTAQSKSDQEQRLDDVETAVLDFLRRYSVGRPVDPVLLEKMLSSNKLGGDTTNMVGKILIQRPIAIEALLGYLYKPGTKRLVDVSHRHKCAKLVARAVLAAEDVALKEARSVNKSIDVEELDEVELSRNIAQGSMLCERIENMVSFTVSADVANKKVDGLSPGEQLCSLAINCPAAAQGVLIWAKELTKGDEFVNSASYLSISPNIMSLVRILFLKHPFLKDKTCDVAFEFLRHTSENVHSMDSIKQQSLRLLIFVCVRGEGPTVLDRMASFLKATDDLDGSLIRYFVAGLLQVISPPFSVPFARSFAAMMTVPRCSRAIRNSYFDGTNKKRLQSILGYMKMKISGDLDTRPVAKDDISLINSLLRVYNR